MQNDSVRFAWFWNFWHWSRESFRAEILMRDPLHGFSGNWLAWYSRTAAADDLAAIDAIGRDERAQRALIHWLVRHWAGEADLGQNRSLARYVVTQLSTLAPFDGWAGFRSYRVNRAGGGVAAIVLAQGSEGE